MNVWNKGFLYFFYKLFLSINHLEFCTFTMYSLKIYLLNLIQISKLFSRSQGAGKSTNDKFIRFITIRKQQWRWRRWWYNIFLCANLWLAVSLQSAVDSAINGCSFFNVRRSVTKVGNYTVIVCNSEKLSWWSTICEIG